MSTPAADGPLLRKPARRLQRRAIVGGVLAVIVGVGGYAVWDNHVDRRQAIDACTARVEARVEASGAGTYTVTSVKARDYDTYSIAGLVYIADDSGERAMRDFLCTVVDGRLVGFAIRFG